MENGKYFLTTTKDSFRTNKIIYLYESFMLSIIDIAIQELVAFEEKQKRIKNFAQKLKETQDYVCVLHDRQKLNIKNFEINNVVPYFNEENFHILLEAQKYLSERYSKKLLSFLRIKKQYDRYCNYTHLGYKGEIYFEKITLAKKRKNEEVIYLKRILNDLNKIIKIIYKQIYN